MTPQGLFLEAAAHGLRVEVEGDRLKVTPAYRLTSEFTDLLRQHKAELLAWLNTPTGPGVVPPPDLPLSPIQPLPTPANREHIIAFLLRQTGDRPGPLAAWLVRRECAYYDGPGRHWDCALLSYAAARDAATWQLKCSEGQVWRMLEEMEPNSKLTDNP